MKVKRAIEILTEYYKPDDDVIIEWLNRDEIIEQDEDELATLAANHPQNPKFLTEERWSILAAASDAKLETDMHDSVISFIEWKFAKAWEVEDE